MYKNIEHAYKPLRSTPIEHGRSQRYARCPCPLPTSPRSASTKTGCATRAASSFDTYDALWRWSVTDLDAFWQSIWDYSGIQSPTPHTAVLAEARMPGARWFPGAQVNYAREVLRHADAAHAAGMPAIVSDNERGEVREMSWPEMRRQVASLALTLESLGVQRGDRVAAYLPNVPETMVAFLACSSIGAIWSVCAPDMGTAAVVDRFRQIEPKVLIAVDGVHYGGKPLDRSAVVQELRGQLPSVQKLLLVKSPYAASAVPHDVDWAQAIDARRCRGRGLRARLAALRPPDVDRLFERHHRPAQAHRARPGRHHPEACTPAACTTTWARAMAPTTSASASTGTAPPAG